MRRIHLSRHEKEVLRLVASGVGSCPAAYPLHRFTSAVCALDRYRLIDAMYDDRGTLVYAEPTVEGHILLAVNPSLRSSVDLHVAIPIAVALLSITASLIVMSCM